MTTPVCGYCCRSCSAARTPSSVPVGGIRMSVTTTSGWWASTAARGGLAGMEGLRVGGLVDTGEDAVAATPEPPPELVVEDVNLPRSHCVEAGPQILEEPKGIVVVLLLSTFEEVEFAPRAAECG